MELFNGEPPPRFSPWRRGGGSYHASHAADDKHFSAGTVVGGTPCTCTFSPGETLTGDLTLSGNGIGTRLGCEGSGESNSYRQARD
jgi:hypothetical protein